jgi:hypothetical protein
MPCESNTITTHSAVYTEMSNTMTTEKIAQLKLLKNANRKSSTPELLTDVTFF